VPVLGASGLTFGLITVRLDCHVNGVEQQRQWKNCANPSAKTATIKNFFYLHNLWPINSIALIVIHEYQTIKGDSSEVQALAANLLRQDCLVAVPTETVYDLAVNGVDAKAVQRAFNKKRIFNRTPSVIKGKVICFGNSLTGPSCQFRRLLKVK